ncbi:unnamed protein product, partial [Mesorhabditis spiculigera]
MEIRSRTIGRGGFGAVYEVEGHSKRLVVKKLNCSTAEFDKELKTLKLLMHENIVRFYEQPENYPTDDTSQFSIFMEYCECGTLYSVIIDPEIVYTDGTIVFWATGLFDALKYMEEKRIVHYDIKPEKQERVVPIEQRVKCDIYGMGLVVWEAMTRRPFLRKEKYYNQEDQQGNTPGAQILSLVQKACEEDFQKRPTASEVLTLLENLAINIGPNVAGKSA